MELDKNVTGDAEMNRGLLGFEDFKDGKGSAPGGGPSVISP